jgi:uncharacterized membrane protein HdeD (DUF308 family)
MSAGATPQTSARSPAWKWFLALGLLLMGLGMAGTASATLFEFTSMLIFGPFLLASSVVQLLTAFFAERGKERRLHLAAAGLEAVLGFFIMANPLHSVGGLVALVAVFFIVSGMIRLARSLVTETHGRGWMIMTGVVALLLGVCVGTGWPDSRLWFVGLCLAVDFICHGVSWSALALRERNPAQV